MAADARLRVTAYPSEVLRKRSAMVPTVTQEVRRLSEAMIETMRVAGGIGLAAPQIGVLKRLFVTGAQKDEYRVFINPEIVQKSARTTRYEESCLSLPEVYADVHRPVWVRIRAWNEFGEIVEGRFSGLLARVYQHEVDHLNGILFVDHLGRKKRERLLTRYQKRIESPQAVWGNA